MPDGIRWVSWPMREMGLGPEESLPVFVQGHALRHLQERMDDIDQPGWSQWYLARALDRPNVVRRQPDGSWLVEYRINENRCGYLAVGRADCGLLVRTFLFLTMRGTPEGDRLHRRFHLTRGEADWLNLHRLSSFTRTDLGGDAELREILTACDCGHLLDMNTEDEISPRVGFAAQVRKFVGMTPIPDGDPADDGASDGDAGHADVRQAA
jgi:hypothetical protein